MAATKQWAQDPVYQLLIIHPEKPEVLYAGNNDGIYKTVNGTEAWATLAEAPRSITSLAIHPASPEILFAGTTSGLYRSTDAGRTGPE